MGYPGSPRGRPELWLISEYTPQLEDQLNLFNMIQGKMIKKTTIVMDPLYERNLGDYLVSDQLILSLLIK